MRYLGRYTDRMAISNHRITAFDGQRVSFLWRDYAHGGKQRVMTLDALNFLSRFFVCLAVSSISSLITSLNSSQPSKYK